MPRFKRQRPSRLLRKIIFLVGHGDGMTAVDRTIARLNIEHYRKLLANETDKTRRFTLQRLLAEEEAKLAVLEKLVDARGREIENMARKSKKAKRRAQAIKKKAMPAKKKKRPVPKSAPTPTGGGQLP